MKLNKTNKYSMRSEKRQKSRFTAVVCVITLLVFVLVGCSSNKEELILTENEITAEYGKSIHFEKYIKYDGYEDYEVTSYDPYKIGSQTVILTATYEGVVHEGSILVENNDNNPPTITQIKDLPEFEEGTNINLLEYFLAEDKIDGVLEIQIKTSLDGLKAGEHLVILESIDKAGLITNKTVTVKIKSKEVTKEETTPPPSTSSPSSSPESTGGSSDSSSGGYTEKPNTSSPSIETPSSPKPADIVFLFADGYDMDSSESACTSYIISAQEKGYAGRCQPLKENGIYIGYKAIIQ